MRMELPTLTEKYRAKLVTMYRSKYYNLFVSKYEWKGITKEAEYFVMQTLWDSGTIAAFKLGDNKVFDTGLIGFGKWVRTAFDGYNCPTEARILNPFNAPGYPTGTVRFGVDSVYMYAQRDRLPILTVVDTYINNIIDAEMIIKTHEFAQKLPLLIKTSPESEEKLKELVRKIWRNEPTIFVAEMEANSVDALSTGAPFLLDKLYQYKDQREGELKTFLGIDNSTRMENTIIPNSDMVNANNMEINTSEDVFLTPMKKFCEEVGEVLGITISVEPKQKPVDSIHDKKESEDNE